MSLEVAELLQEAKQVLGERCAEKAAALLQDPDARLVDGAPTREPVKALLPTLKARFANSARSGTQIYGITELIARLEAMSSSNMVIGYGFISPLAAGVIYLADENGPALGAAIVDR